MGKSLSLTVVAQGVETREQAEFLRDHACDELQGFYMAKPMSAAEIRQLLGASVTDTRKPSPPRRRRSRGRDAA